MKFIVHSRVDASAIPQKFGLAQYSYYFVLAGYLPALQALGEVVPVADPETQVDAIYDAAVAAGEDCVFLCFAPPQLVPLGLRCPTVPVIAWEFSNFPCEQLDDDPRSDWRVVFRACGRVITLSRHTAGLVREVMGADFPVFAIPTATFEAFARLGAAGPAQLGAREFGFKGYLYDSGADPVMQGGPSHPFPPAPPIVPPEPAPAPPPAPPEIMLPPMPPVAARRTLRQRVSLTVHYGLLWYREVVRDALPGPVKRAASGTGRLAYRAWRLARPLPPPPVIAPPPPPPPPLPLPEVNVNLSGVVYTTVFAHRDGRKNWQDFATAFLWTFRDNPDATLLMKLPASAATEALPIIHFLASRYAPLRCRVLVACGFLDDAAYADLIRATTYYVNTSHGEGLCLPLMEFLSAGKPAVAPRHTAMADYITPQIAFIPRTSLEHNVWPQDKRDLFTTMRHRMNWASLQAALGASFAAAHTAQYEAMSEAAVAGMRAFCATEVVRDRLAAALMTAQPAAPAPQEAMA